MDFEFDTLSIVGHDNHPIQNTFFRQTKKSDHLTIIFPGRGYTCAMPLLYYTTNILLGLGADVLQVEYKYPASFFDLSEKERAQKFNFDVRASIEAGLSNKSYSRLTLVGKSLGTRALGYLATAPELTPPAEFVRSVWLTPITADDSLYSQMKASPFSSFYAVGTADIHSYLPDRLKELEDKQGWKGIVINGADHSLDIDEDTLRSLDEMKRTVQAVQEFLI